MPDPVNWYTMSQTITDIGTAGSTRFVARQSGFLRRIQVMLHGAITGTTETVTVQIDNATAVAVGTIPAAASAEGTLLTPTGNTVTGSRELYLPVKAGSNVEVVNDGASTGTAAATISVTLSP